MFSVVMPDKSVQDIKYVKRSQDTLIKLGSLTIGQIFKMGHRDYSVVVNGHIPHPLLRNVDGLTSRYYCTKFALEVLGYWNTQK